VTITEVAVDDNDAEVDHAPEMNDAPRGFAHAAAARWRLIIVGVLLIAATAAAAGLYFAQYRPDQQTSDAVAASALSAASQGTETLLSYAPESLDRDIAAAKAQLTGEFLTYYGKFADQIVLPAAKENAVKTTASVARAAVAELHPDTAKVLVFLNQETTSREKPEPALTASSVVVTLSKTNGKWLISAFDPV
jgi:Mce-associated membrane protein